MKTPQQLRSEAVELRAFAKTLFNLSQTHIALGKLSEATRRETYAELLEGKRDILKTCIELQKLRPGPTNRAATQQRDSRRYQLIDTGGLRGNCDFLTRQAYQRIAQRQIEKPYRKPMPPPVFKLTS